MKTDAQATAEIAAALADAETALRRAQRAAAGEVPPAWSTAIARARAAIEHPRRMSCALSGAPQ